MKYLLTFTLWVSLISIAFPILAQTHTEKLEERYDAPSVLYVLNINGSIDLVGRQSSSILLKVDQELTADSNNDLNRAKQEVSLKSLRRGDTLIVYMQAPFLNLVKNSGKWQYKWENNRQKSNYDFTMDFSLSVPNETEVYLSTINKGSISVANILAPMNIRNVNGGIKMGNVSGQTDVHTINGDIDIYYDRNPRRDSKYYTLNGDLNIYFQPDLSADVTFKSFNGELFSYFDYNMLPAQLTKNVSNKKAKTEYKIEKLTHLRIKNGGPLLALETFNGNVYLKKN